MFLGNSFCKQRIFPEGLTPYLFTPLSVCIGFILSDVHYTLPILIKIKKSLPSVSSFPVVFHRGDIITTPNPPSVNYFLPYSFRLDSYTPTHMVFCLASQPRAPQNYKIRIFTVTILTVFRLGLQSIRVLLPLRGNELVFSTSGPLENGHCFRVLGQTSNLGDIRDMTPRRNTMSPSLVAWGNDMDDIYIYKYKTSIHVYI